MTQNKIWLSSPHMGGTEQKYIQKAFDAIFFKISIFLLRLYFKLSGKFKPIL
jgi:hypothetical protein